MSEMLYDYLKLTDECGSQDLVMGEFEERKIPYALYERVRQSAAEQGLVTGVSNTSSGYFVPDDASLTVKGMMFIKTTRGSAIEPDHYNKGEVDLYESWYLTRPFGEFRAIMESIAERYIKRDKTNRLEDLDKGIYTLQRLREYEVRHEQEKTEKATDEHGSQTDT